MNPKIILWLAFILSGCFFGCSTTKRLSNLPIYYHNAKYDLTFYLPANWRGYSVLTQQWKGEHCSPDLDKIIFVGSGPIIILRNPQWQTDNRYQDIPIYIFTHQQWDDVHLGKYDAAGAGGIIFELWHNNQYVFGMHSRYNLDELPGSKEAAEIVEENSVANSNTHLYPQ